MNVPPVFEQEFLPLRAKLVELAAALDRLERSRQLPAREPRMAAIRAAIDALLAEGGDRAEQVQLIFSRPYEDDWREMFGMAE